MYCFYAIADVYFSCELRIMYGVSALCMVQLWFILQLMCCVPLGFLALTLPSTPQAEINAC